MTMVTGSYLCPWFSMAHRRGGADVSGFSDLYFPGAVKNRARNKTMNDEIVCNPGAMPRPWLVSVLLI